eukprot:345407-Pleurochrysis_carterae.AAC.1
MSRITDNPGFEALCTWSVSLEEALMCSLTQAVTKPAASDSTDAPPRRSLGDALLLKPNQIWTPLSMNPPAAQGAVAV